MNRVAALLICSLACLATSCHTTSEPPLTQLQIREIQTRLFEDKSALAVLKEMMNVLQDDAFIIKNANADLGLISAEKEIDLETNWTRTFSILSSSSNGNAPTWKKNMVIEASANVSQFGSHTKVRVNFQKKTYDNFGRVLEVVHIYDPLYYQDFFTKVQQGLFIQQTGI